MDTCIQKTDHEISYVMMQDTVITLDMFIINGFLNWSCYGVSMEMAKFSIQVTMSQLLKQSLSLGNKWQSSLIVCTDTSKTGRERGAILRPLKDPDLMQKKMMQTYIQHWEGTGRNSQYICQLIRQDLLWCMEENIIIKVQHIPWTQCQRKGVFPVRTVPLHWQGFLTH